MTSFLGLVGRDAMAAKHGGFAPRLAIDALRLIRLSVPISDSQAAIVEPATVCLGADVVIAPGEMAAGETTAGGFDVVFECAGVPTVGLSELPEAIARLADDPTSAVKVLVDPSR